MAMFVRPPPLGHLESRYHLRGVTNPRLELGRPTGRAGDRGGLDNQGEEQ